MRILLLLSALCTLVLAEEYSGINHDISTPEGFRDHPATPVAYERTGEAVCNKAKLHHIYSLCDGNGYRVLCQGQKDHYYRVTCSNGCANKYVGGYVTEEDTGQIAMCNPSRRKRR